MAVDGSNALLWGLRLRTARASNVRERLLQGVITLIVDGFVLFHVSAKLWGIRPRGSRSVAAVISIRTPPRFFFSEFPRLSISCISEAALSILTRRTKEKKEGTRKDTMTVTSNMQMLKASSYTKLDRSLGDGALRKELERVISGECAKFSSTG
jgi:hypothetical protein